MAEQEVRSPVCRPGSKVGSGQPLSPGARSNPSGGRTYSTSARPSYGASRHSAEPGEVKIIGLPAKCPLPGIAIM
jgi:hypothetical protein